MSKLIIVLLAACTLAACSGQSALTPSPSSPAGDLLSAKGSLANPGVYTLSFFANVGGTWQEVSSLAVLSQELVLKADVTDISGSPAVKGTVTFEYCSYKGPKNDITRADEAPKEACEQGLARWASLASISIAFGNCAALGTGSACTPFGFVRIPRTIGFRFRYSPQGGSIAAGTSQSKNFTWVAGS